jgi:cyclopropane-fatty-acyl-phospholipid synthase
MVSEKKGCIMKAALEMAERGWLPDSLIRYGIRRLNRKRLSTVRHTDEADIERAAQRFVEKMQRSPIAVETRSANEQHYELPPAFFQRVLGRHLKYSSGFWPTDTQTLDQAEARMLDLTCRRAQIEDGHSILELGCGWGSLSLRLAKNYSKSRIVSVSNSRLQKDFIDGRIAQEGLSNLKVVTEDMNTFDPGVRFDRVVSVEMFEHMRNWPRLLERIHGWLLAQGKLFLHVFSHRDYVYEYEVNGDDNWMGRHFFTGGIMPSDGLIFHMQDRFKVERHWRVNGNHYRQTAEAWLQNLDANRDEILEIMRRAYGRQNAERWLQRWRIFFMACAELFGFRNGKEWMVSQYRLVDRG